VLASPTRLHAGLACGVVCVSWAAILVRLADAPPLAIAAWRLLLAGGATGLFALLRRRAELGGLGRRSLARIAGLLVRTGIIRPGARIRHCRYQGLERAHGILNHGGKDLPGAGQMRAEPRFRVPELAGSPAQRAPLALGRLAAGRLVRGAFPYVVPASAAMAERPTEIAAYLPAELAGT
jgi:hypothetical protein